MNGLTPLEYFRMYGNKLEPEVQKQFETLLKEKEELEKRFEAMRKSLYEILMN